MKTRQTFFYLIFLLIAFEGCKKSDSNDNVLPPDSTLEIWKTSGVAGQIINEESRPIAGATVSFGNKSTTTDLNGYFSFTRASFSAKEAFVTVRKPGYFNGSRTFIPRDGSNNYLKIQLLSAKIIGSVDAASGGTVTIPNGVSIILPGNGIVNSKNVSFSGKVTVSAVYIDPTAPDIKLQMPGNLMGMDAGDRKKLLKSFGMVAVELSSYNGEKLNIKKGYSATLNFLIPNGISSSAPSVIPLWSFDETTGMWKEEGQAVRQGSRYIGAVNHFTFWNVGEPVDYAKLSMRLVSSQGNPVAGLAVKLTSLVSETSAYDFTDNLGYIDGYVPTGGLLQMQVVDNCQNEIFNKNIGPFNSDTDLGDVTLTADLSLQTITGKVQNCEGLPLKTGTLQVFLDGSHFELTNIQNGSFSITFPNCAGNNIVKLIAIDESAMQTSEGVSLTLSANIMDAGVIRACGISIPPFFTINIDGSKQTWPNTVFGAWIDPDVTFGDNSTPIELFEGDTSLGIKNRIGMLFNIKAYNPIHAPDSATLISVSLRGSVEWYQALNQGNFMLKIDNFGEVGKIFEGNFNGSFLKLKGCCPNSIVLDTVNINGTFRIKRDTPWWPS